MRRIAVLTSGGDAPGMNPCIRAVVRSAEYLGFEIFGVRRGYVGLVNNDIYRITGDDVSDIAQAGGTMLKSARLKNFQDIELQRICATNLQRLDIDGLIVIGGDGSFRGARDLSVNFGVNVVGLPGTIDNDLSYTDYTIGFATAVNTVLENMDRIRDTMFSHERVCVMEVMGRNCGDIALFAGITGGADFIILPDHNDIDIDYMAKKIVDNRNKQRNSNIIIVAEGAGTCKDLRNELEARVGGDMFRDMKLGHLQRGGVPCMSDVLLATKYGVRAVELLAKNKTCRVVGVKDEKIFDMDIVEALKAPNRDRTKLYELSKIISQ